MKFLRSNAQAAANPPGLFPPAVESEINKAEEILGLELPRLLKRIYREIGNGGRCLGPGNGLFGLESGYEDGERNLLTWTLEFVREYEWWDDFIVISEKGCGMFYCVDCGDSDHAVYHVDGNDVASWMDDENYDPDEYPDYGWDIECDTFKQWLLEPNT